jgi:hypothetical protein
VPRELLLMTPRQIDWYLTAWAKREKTRQSG